MTINIADNDPRVSYSVAAGVTQSSFVVDFAFFDETDLNVYVDGTQKTLTTDYTVTGGDGSTGTVTISVTGVSGGSTVVITRSIDLERTTDFPVSGSFNISSLNTELDRFVAINADLKDQADRSLQLTDYDVAANLRLPDLNTRKGKTLAFNAVTGDVESGPSITSVSTLSSIATDIETLADIEDGTVATTAISDLAAIASDVTTVASVSGNVTTVAGISADVTTVAGINADVTTVAGDTVNIGTVAGISANVTTVAGISSDVTTVAGDSADIQAVAADAVDIGTVATNIADVNTAAANITAIQNASTNAANAATSAANALTSENNAATSATNAATSATAAAASQVAAAASAASAATAYDSFDDRYLGTKTSDPTVDNDGNALVTGALYFNSTANEMRVYDGTNWIAASSAGGVSLLNYNYTATASQTTFSGTDDNAATLSYTAQNIIVALNGIVLEDGTDYTATNGTSIVLSSGAAAGDELNIVAFKPFTTADMVPASTGGTFSGNISAPKYLGSGNKIETDIFRVNAQTLSSNTTIGATENASCTGPLAVASGVTLTVTSGGNLSVV